MKRQAVLESLILTIRNQKVLLDADLATIYGVETRVINQAVKRNADRFPEDFRFQLTREEAAALFDSRSQFVTLKRGQNIKYQPYAFTEHAAIMAATVLNSPEAVKMSVFVVRAFVQMREQLAANSAILKRLAENRQDPPRTRSGARSGGTFSHCSRRNPPRPDHALAFTAEHCRACRPIAGISQFGRHG